MKAFAAIALLLGGCAHSIDLPRPPADKLVCPDEPGRPIGKGEVYVDSRGQQRRAVTDEEAADYMVKLRAAGQGCRDDVDWLRVWFRSLQKK